MDAATSTTDAAMFMGASLLDANCTSGLLGPVGLLAAEKAANGRGVETALLAAAELEAALLGHSCGGDGLRPLMILPSAIGL